MPLADAFAIAASNGRRTPRRRAAPSLFAQEADDQRQAPDLRAYVGGPSGGGASYGNDVQDDDDHDNNAASAGSDNDEDNDDNIAEATGSEGRAARPRGPRESFLSLVSPKPSARRTAARRTDTRHPYVRRYAGTRLESEIPKYAFTYRSGMTDEPQYTSMGMVRGTIATMPLSELRPAIAYMLEHADPDGRRPTMLARPANFERFEELRDPSGGRDILLHEIFKEDDGVLTDLFLIAGRVGHRGRRARTVGQRASDMLGGAVSASSSLDTANDIPYERMRRPADFRPALTRPEYRVVNPGALVPLLANVAGAGDDPTVFITQPARSVKGRRDGNPLVLHGVCDDQVEDYFDRTSNEVERSGLPELGPYAVLRDQLAEYRRPMCPVEPKLVRKIVRHLANGEPADTVNALDEETVGALVQNGFTRDEINSLWGRSASATA